MIKVAHNTQINKLEQEHLNSNRQIILVMHDDYRDLMGNYQKDIDNLMRKEGENFNIGDTIDYIYDDLLYTDAVSSTLQGNRLIGFIIEWIMIHTLLKYYPKINILWRGGGDGIVFGKNIFPDQNYPMTDIIYGTNKIDGFIEIKKCLSEGIPGQYDSMRCSNINRKIILVTDNISRKVRNNMIRNNGIEVHKIKTAKDIYNLGLTKKYFQVDLRKTRWKKYESEQ